MGNRGSVHNIWDEDLNEDNEQFVNERLKRRSTVYACADDAVAVAETLTVEVPQRRRHHIGAGDAVRVAAELRAELVRGSVESEAPVAPQRECEASAPCVEVPLPTTPPSKSQQSSPHCTTSPHVRKSSPDAQRLPDWLLKAPQGGIPTPAEADHCQATPGACRYVLCRGDVRLVPGPLRMRQSC